MEAMKREWVWAIVSLIIAIVLSYILLSLARDDAKSKVAYDCVDPTERERVRDIALQGIDEGLKLAMAHLYEVWQKDPATAQPQRAQVGTTNAINAHNRGRKLALAWSPPDCPKEP
jgi:hypothetical protein